MIISAIIFLGLLLIGIGCSYYCLKRRNIKMVKRRPASTLGSEITKISEPISMFDGLKIPRAHAEDTSGSEEMTESVRSEFASEVISTASEEEFTSAYSDGPFELPEGTVFAQLHAPPVPGFDVRTKISKGDAGIYSAVESTASSESEVVLRAQEQYLTTILEKTETNTLETLERIRRAEAKAGPPPVHARVRVVNKAQLSDNSELESESEYQESQVSDYYQGKLKLATAEQTPFTIGLQDAATLHMQHEQQEQEEMAQRKVRYDQRMVVEELEQRQAQEHRHETVMSSRHDRYKTEKEQVVGHSSTAQDLITPVIVERATANMRISPARNNFDVLIRVLDEPQNFNLGATTDEDEVSSVLTEEERYRLREVIMTDEKIQTILKETHTTEKMLMLKDYREIGQVIPPQKWDVLIRVIDNAENASQRRSDDKTSISTYGGRKTTGSSVTAQEMRYLSNLPIFLQRSYFSFDNRSMSEIMVDYGYAEHHQETRSGYSGRSSTVTHSAADRSGAEIVASDHFINREAYFSSEQHHREEHQ